MMFKNDELFWFQFGPTLHNILILIFISIVLMFICYFIIKFFFKWVQRTPMEKIIFEKTSFEKTR